MDTKSFTGKLLLVLFISNLIASYFVPFDYSKPVFAALLAILYLFTRHTELMQQPDIRKEVADKLKAYEDKIAELQKGQEHLYKNLKNDVSKYETLLTKVNNAPGKSIRF